MEKLVKQLPCRRFLLYRKGRLVKRCGLYFGKVQAYKQKKQLEKVK